jgi:hypothetical protein
MYIRIEDGEHILVRLLKEGDGRPKEVLLARLGQDPELNLFLSADAGRRKDPALWQDVSDFHLLQALENFKRRTGGFKPALVAVRGGLQS